VANEHPRAANPFDRLVTSKVEHNSAPKAAAIANALANESSNGLLLQRQNRSMKMFFVLKGQASQ